MGGSEKENTKSTFLRARSRALAYYVHAPEQLRALVCPHLVCGGDLYILEYRVAVTLAPPTTHTLVHPVEVGAGRGKESRKEGRATH